MGCMARFRYYVASSADGYIADERDNLDWLLEVEFDGQEESMSSFLAEVGALVMGADTYGWLLAHADGDWPYADLPTWVFTHRELAAFPGANLTFIRGDVSEWVDDIAEDAGGKDVWVVGGGSVAGQFVDGGFLDELIHFTVPVVLGGGKPLFALRGTARLAEISHTDHGRGVHETRYDIVRPAPARPDS